MTSPAAWQQWGDQYGQHPTGTGPFKLREWLNGHSMTLDRNPDYDWAPAISTNQGPAYLDSITFKFIPDADCCKC